MENSQVFGWSNQVILVSSIEIEKAGVMNMSGKTGYQGPTLKLCRGIKYSAGYKNLEY